MNSEPVPTYDKEEVRLRMPLFRVLQEEGIELRRSGPHLVARCPFHEERSGSFTLHGPHAEEAEHAHCYGCGWHGDVFRFVAERAGLALPGDFARVLELLAARAAVSPSVHHRPAKSVSRMTEVTLAEKEKPALPPMRKLNEAEVQALADLRGLSRAAIFSAIAERVLAMAVWPQFANERGDWFAPQDAGDCWVVGDRTRNVCQFRRLDGAPFTRRDGGKIKAWTKGSPTWPIGAGQLGDRACVLLVEGGADMLAAFHFLALFGQLGRVAVVAMFGASMRICAEALPFFAGKRVRIMMDEDAPKDGGDGKRAGAEAAARWQEQLTLAGAAVEVFSLAGLVRADGAPVKDLNDLALCSEEVWLDPELKAAFLDFEF